MSHEKILSHPKKAMIIRMLSRGDGIRAVAKAIKECYPNDKKMHLSTPTLQKFRDEKLNITGETLKAIKKATKEKNEIKTAKKEDTKLSRIPAFREAVEKAANMHVDIRQELQELLATVKSRVEDLFDRAAEGSLSVNEEANLSKYFAQWTATIQQWAKYIDKIADRTVEANININVIEDQMAVLRVAVKETIEEMDPDIAPIFMRKLSEKMEELSYRKQKTESINAIHTTTNKLAEKIRDAEVEDD